MRELVAGHHGLRPGVLQHGQAGAIGTRDRLHAELGNLDQRLP
jgi:hypothetical protein